MPEKDTDTTVPDDEKTDEKTDEDDAKVDDDLLDGDIDDLLDESDSDKKSDKKKERTYTTAQMTKIVKREKAREAAKRGIAEKQAAAQATKEAEEAKLLEEGKTQELLDMRTKEAEEAKAELDELKRVEKAGLMLDKEEITDPEERRWFLKMRNPELADLKKDITTYKAMQDRRVQEAVAKRLGTNPPPKAGEQAKEKGVKDMTTAEYMEYKKKTGMHGGLDVTKLKV